MNDETVVFKDITNECETRNSDYGPMVYYKDVPLWMTIYSEDPKDCGCKIQIVREFLGYTILGETPVAGFDDMMDYSTYGDWESIEEVERWLDNPEPLY